MKIDRRSFLSLGIGAGAGIALTPLPWKLADDSSIWTQMWPWTPVPARGEATYVNSACSLCPGSCGISVRKIDERAVKIEGMEGHPVNDGGVCPIGIAGLQLLYGQTRVKTPLKRVGKRGEGKWQKISWDEAISEVSSNLAELRKSGNPQSLACISGSGRYGTVSGLFQRFMTAFGSPNFMSVPSFVDGYSMALKQMHGIDSIPGFDFENSDFILSFGSGIIDGWGAPVRMFKANANMKGKIVQIEPRLSNTAAKADKWIPIKPGTEAALALGLAHVIIKKSLYNKDFISKHSFGFDDMTGTDGKKVKGFKSLVMEKYTPASVARITDTSAEMIEELAVSFAKASSPLAVCGRGKGTAQGSLDEYIAVHALNALLGRVNTKGGVWAVEQPNYISWPYPDMDKIAEKGFASARIDGAGTDEFPLAGQLAHRFVNAVADAGRKEIPVEALLIEGANPLHQFSDTKAVKKAFSKIKFIASFSSYMDDSAQFADIILPNHCYLERYEDIPAPAGLQKPVIGISRPVVAPKYNTLHSGDAIIRIAKALGDKIESSFSWDSYEACLQATFREAWSKLDSVGFLINQKYGAPGWDQFETESKLFEFISSADGAKTGRDKDEIVNIADIEGKGDKKYNLTLISYDSIRLASGSVGNTPFMIKAVADTILKENDIFVEINPKTAKDAGVKEGAKAVLTTPKGSANVRVHLFEGIVPGVIAMPRGLGHTGDDKYLSGKGVNVHDLIGPVEDPASGLDAAWGIRAKLAKA
ncbi:molybdopterin-dependent oxidoreductase [Desulfobacterales bacterium HSG16]|nr:molybdopterin-dependent oxidoreductase [Desulfobacterales bacterium HSG16]